MFGIKKINMAFLKRGEISEEEEVLLKVWKGTEWHRIRVDETKKIRAATVAFGAEHGSLVVPLERRITQYLLPHPYLPHNFHRVAMKRVNDAGDVLWSRAARCPWCQSILVLSTSNAPLVRHRQACIRTPD